MNQIHSGNVDTESLAQSWPKEWQQLCRQLIACKTTDAAVHWLSAEWHDVKQRGGYPTRLPPDWHALARHVCIPVPVVEKDLLEFVPRLRRLPLQLVVPFAAFLVRLQAQIPARDLQQFAAAFEALRSCGGVSPPAAGKASGDVGADGDACRVRGALHGQLQAFTSELLKCAERRHSPSDQRDDSDVSPPSKKPNRAPGNELPVESVDSSKEDGRQQGEAAPVKDVGEGDSTTESSARSAEPGVQQGGESLDGQLPCSQSSTMSSVRTPHRRCLSRSDLDAQPCLLLLDAPTKRLEVRHAKHCETYPLAPIVRRHICRWDISEVVVVRPERRLALSRLLDDFLSGSERAVFSDLNVISSLTLAQVVAFLLPVDVASLSDASIAAVVQQLSSMPAELSVSVSDYVCSHLVAPKIVSLAHLASRSLYSSVVQLLGRYPRAVLASVLVPVLSNPQTAGGFQCELVRRLVREVFTAQQSGELASGLLSTAALARAEQWTDEQISCLQTLLETKVFLDAKSCSDLAVCLEQQAVVQAKNLKFAKLFLAVVQRQGVQMLPHLAVLRVAAEANSTFLKKPLLVAIKKLL